MSDNVVPLDRAREKRKKTSPPPPPPREGWEAELLLTAKGAVRSNLANAITILSRHPHCVGVIGFDAFAEAIVKRKAPPTREQDAPTTVASGEWTDEDTSRIAAWIASQYAIDLGSKVVDQAVAVVAMRNVHHPVRAYLESLSWDQTERLPTFLSVYFGADDAPYTRGIGTRWLISAVARVMRPGCQADCTLVLEGKQGTGKSTGLEALVPNAEWFADTGVTIGDKDSYQSLRRKWIYEIGELASIKGRDVERTKNFLSARSDNYRPSYGHRNRDFPRQVVFAATTNEQTYLVDQTGNRRFWPVRCGAVNVAGIRSIRDQIWAEAKARYDRAEPWHVDSADFAKLCTDQQDARVQTDPWTEIVARWLKVPTVTRYDVRDGGKELVTLRLADGLLTSDVLVGALGIKSGDITRADETRIGIVLRDLGLGSRRISVAGERERRYFCLDNPGQPTDGGGLAT